VLNQWQNLFSDWLDVAGFVLFLLAFPVYHTAYPWLMLLFPNRAAKVRLDEFRRSWIERLVKTRDLMAAAQQTRNLAMVNSLLASSALILMGFTANVLLGTPRTPAPGATGDGEALGNLVSWAAHPESLQLKLLLLILVFGVSFAYSMTALRHLGHFNLVVGADPDVIARREGSAVDYLSALINRASNRATLAVRCLYSATPLFLWVFDVRLFVLVTIVWMVKFVAFQDFAHLRRGAGAEPSAPSPALPPDASPASGGQRDR
jgi:uncharacterized membrane protein